MQKKTTTDQAQSTQEKYTPLNTTCQKIRFQRQKLDLIIFARPFDIDQQLAEISSP
ncbi:hypothetical protein [Nitrosomonas cryotolerans]|nr:hypothetical protein [Nitrosomonas cryotolerans]